MKRLLQLTALMIVLAFTGQTAMAFPIIQRTWCGDPCSPNGAETGCNCTAPNGQIYRDICICINGHWSA